MPPVLHAVFGVVGTSTPKCAEISPESRLPSPEYQDQREVAIQMWEMPKGLWKSDYC